MHIYIYIQPEDGPAVVKETASLVHNKQDSSHEVGKTKGQEISAESEKETKSVINCEREVVEKKYPLGM